MRALVMACVAAVTIIGTGCVQGKSMSDPVSPDNTINVGTATPVNPLPAAADAPAAAPITGSEAARSSDSLIESMGVAVHIRYSQNTNLYTTVYKPLLMQAGIRYIRDGGTGTKFFADLNDLAANGIHSTLVMDPRENIDPSTMVANDIEPVINSVVAIEGANEWDDTMSMTYKGQSFPAGLVSFQTDLYNAIHQSSDAQVRAINVLAPALANPRNAGMVGQVPCDMGNMHSYPGGPNMPDDKLNTLWIPDAQIMSGGKPVVASETGYNDNLSSGMANQPGVSDLAAAKYAPRLYMDYFNHHVVRTHLYNMSTDDTAWSMLHADGTPKASYNAIKNTISILSDAGAGFTPGSISYSLAGDTTGVHHLLLGKRNGHYYLAVWLNVASYNTTTNKDLSTTRTMTLSVKNLFSSVNVYQPRTSASPTATVAGQPAALALNVSDDMLIVELVP